MPNIDKITVTFYGDDDCNVANKFREILEHKGLSLNMALKLIIKRYVEDFVK